MYYCKALNIVKGCQPSIYNVTVKFWSVLVHGLKLTAYSNKALLHVGRWSQPHKLDSKIDAFRNEISNFWVHIMFLENTECVWVQKYQVDLSSSTSYSLVYHLGAYCFF